MKKLSLLAIGLCACLFASAQKVIVKGDLKCLKGVDAVSVNFSYDNMQVGKMTEADGMIYTPMEIKRSRPR